MELRKNPSNLKENYDKGKCSTIDKIVMSFLPLQMHFSY